MQRLQLTQDYFNPKQLKLPLSFEILIPFDSEARTFDEVFRRINLKQYLVSKSDVGRNGYNTVNMLKLILFCYMENITSSREIEKAARNDIRLMWLTDELKPSHQTINQFINNHLSDSIESIFYELNKYIIKTEQIETDKLYIDGTKIEANSNRYKFIWKGSYEKFREKLYLKITKLLNKLNEGYQAMGIYFPVSETYEVETLSKIEQFIGQQMSLSNITSVYGKGKHKTMIQRDYDHIKDYIEKLTTYNDYIETIGPNRNSCAKTDKDATFMRMKEDHMRNGQLKPGYNIQIGVSNEYILHLGIYQDRNDYQTLIPFLEGYYKAYGYYPKYPVADAGYGGLKNYRYLKDNGMALYQKYSLYAKETGNKKYMNDMTRPVNFKRDDLGNYYDQNGERLEYLWHSKRGPDVYEVPSTKKRIDINPELWALQKEARENLQSSLGIELRMQRSIQVEGAFGIIKEDYGFRRFKRRGMTNVALEFTLIAIGYNLSKIHNKKYRSVQ